MPITPPSWPLPDAVLAEARRIEARGLLPAHEAVLQRLVSDPQMEAVWRELTRKNRRTGGYLHAGRPREGKPPLNAEDGQARALVWLFRDAYSLRERGGVTLADVERHREQLLVDAAFLTRIAEEESIRSCLSAAEEAEAMWAVKVLMGCAIRRRDEIRNLPGAADPNVVINKSEDTVQRGTQGTLGHILQETFGSPLHKVAATLAGVILDAKPLDPSVTRSAVLRQKEP